MAIQALAVVPAKVATATAKVATTVAHTATKAATTATSAATRVGTVASNVGRSASSVAGSVGRSAHTATSSVRSAGSAGQTAMRSSRGMVRTPRPNGLTSQIAKRLESIKQNDPPSGEALMRAKADRFKAARASSKGPFAKAKGLMDQYVEMAAGKYNEEGMSR